MIGERVIQQQQKMVKKIKNYIYDPQQVIGSGFSSKVYKGINQLTQETIAIKVLELHKIQSQVQKYLLNNQINALRALNHPHILRTVEILMTKNNVYIMTEFCESGDLQQYIKKQGKLSQLQALRIIKDVTDGYLAIEQKLIVHRDLKTANIFLTNTGARIADFGFCEFLNQTKKPQLFYNVGSPAYMSPQSYRQNIYSAKSDVWSIGIILYEMLIGQTPDKNLTYSQMSNNLMSGRITSGPNQQIRYILSQCFKKDLKQRINPLNLLDLINKEINRQESLKGSRPQLITAQANSIKLNSSNSMHPIQYPTRSANRHMVSSSLPQQSHENSNRGQSPGKVRFNGIMFREEGARNVQPSPVKFIDRRFSKEQDIARVSYNHRIKSATQALIFLYRLLNSLSEYNIQHTSSMRLIIFRHRNYLQNTAQRITLQDHLDRHTYQPLKQFHFLKSKFDEAYLQKQFLNSNQYTTSHKKLQEIANLPFNQPRSIQLYMSINIEIARQCQRILLMANDENEANKLGVMLDYLLIHFELMVLYNEGKNLESICQQYILMSLILKQQSRKLSPYHYALLRHKLKLLSKHLQQSKQQQRNGFEESPGYKQLNQIPQRKTLLMNGFF